MEAGRKKAASRNNIATGSIWESRMIIDEVKGGIKVFNGGSNSEEADDDIFANVNAKEKSTLPSSRRKTWKCETPEDRIQIVRSTTSIDEGGVTAVGGTSVVSVGGAVAEGVRKSPIQRKMRSDACAPSTKAKSEKSMVDTPESAMKTTSFLRKSKSERKKTVDANPTKPKAFSESRVYEKAKISGSSRELVDDREDSYGGYVHMEEIDVNDPLATSSDLEVVDFVEGEAKGVVVVGEKKTKEVKEKQQARVLFAHNSAGYMPMKLMKDIKKSEAPSCNGEALQTSACFNNLMNLVDLVMWRDASRSAFVFGAGTFLILLLSYTNEFNISFFTLSCYVGLLYLAANCLYKTLTTRSAIDVSNWRRGNAISEEDAILLLKLVLPHINRFLSNIRCLFSGDPITTVKMAVLLFLLAMTGCSISMFQMVKIGFFGAFTLPKIYSLHGERFTTLAGFWVLCFRDVLDSCSHKKAVGGAVFVFILSMSSATVRIWTVLWALVGGSVKDNKEEEDECWHDARGGWGVLGPVEAKEEE